MNFKTIKRRAIVGTGESMVHLTRIDGARPLVIEPALQGLDPYRWASENRDFIQAELLRHGAILFRGFPISTMDSFHLFVRSVSSEAMEYKERSSPRSQVGDNIYTSTDYPATESIFPHNEHSYAQTFPLKLYFWCDVPARSGGETPLGDTRNMLQRIPENILQDFAEKGWMFVRNFNDGFGLPWQTVFQSDDRQEVEAYCRRNEIEYEWRDGDRLRTRQVRPALFRHPHSGELVWFNHATFFHISTLPESVRIALRAEYKSDELPNNTFYGDGSPIPEEVMSTLRNIYLTEMTMFPWKTKDVLLLDNMLTSHARQPFEGPRRTLVAMSEPCKASTVAVPMSHESIFNGKGPLATC